MPDTAFIVRPNSLQMETVGKLQTYTFILDVQSDQLPEFLETYDVTGSWISAFNVPKPETDHLMVGAPTMRVVQPPYDERDKDLHVVARVTVLHEGPSSGSLNAFTAACHKAWSKQVFREELERSVDAGMAPQGALLQALNQPLLHNTELHHITHAHPTGHVRLFFYSKAAAQKVRQADYVTLGVIGGHEMKLTPRTDVHPTGKRTWINAIVSSNLPGAEFAKPSMLLQHFQLLSTTAEQMGTGMGSNGRLKTVQPKLYFYDNASQVLDSSQVFIENVLSIFFAPMGTSFKEMAEEELTKRVGSRGGLKCCLLPADPLTASLCLTGCWQRQLENSVGSETLLYGTHALSSVGRTPPLPQQAPSNRGRGRASGGRGRTANSAPSLKPSRFTAMAATILMAEQKPMSEAQFTSLVKEADDKETRSRVIQRMSLALASLPPQTVPAAMAEVSPDSPDAFEMLVGGPAIPAPKDSPTDSPVERVEKAMGHLSTGDHHQRKKKRTSQDDKPKAAKELFSQYYNVLFGEGTSGSSTTPLVPPTAADSTPAATAAAAPATTQPGPTDGTQGGGKDSTPMEIA